MEQILKCKICHYSYNTEFRKPILIMCGHTFCKLCISKLENSKCRICGLTVDLNLLITNYIVEDIMKIIENDNNSPLIGYRYEKRSTLSANTNFTNYIRREVSPVNINRFHYSERKINQLRKKSSIAIDEEKEIDEKNIHNKEETLETIPLQEDKSFFDNSFTKDVLNLFTNNNKPKDSDFKSYNKDLKLRKIKELEEIKVEDIIRKLNDQLKIYNENERKIYSEYISQGITRPIFINNLKDVKFSINKHKDVFISFQVNSYFKGIIYYSSGDFYEGEWIDERKEGYGIFIYKNSTKYEGNFKNNKQNGYGKLSQHDGEVYIGEWKDGKICGNGIRYHSNGDKYEGQYMNNIRHGVGTYYFYNGDFYEGEWIQGKACKKGKFVYSNGDIYEGEFKENQIWGKGTFTLSNGDIYKGNFINGFINGVGFFKSIKGELYQGDFLNGKRHGYGQITNPDGSNYCGYWNNDNYMGKKNSL